jgi:outer membrane protein assembly factor BamB
VPGKASGGVIEGETVYYSLDGKPRAAYLKSGKLLWETTDVTVMNKIEVFGDQVLVEAMPNVYVLDKKSGHLLHRLHDVKYGASETTSAAQMNGVLTVLDGKLYLGSSNGYFGKVGK